MGVIKSERLIFCNILEGTNSNKFYHIDLYDDGTVKAEWGRISTFGTERTLRVQQKGTWTGGESFFNKKVAKQLKEGYERQRTITAGPVPIAQGNLESLALSQIKYTDASVENLIKYLCQTNVHNILSSTTLNYDTSKGTFSTPLGPLTQDGINEARRLLLDIKPYVVQNDLTNISFQRTVNSYIKIVPQDFGRQKITAQLVFPDLEAIQKQNDILDSLEASLTSMTVDNSTEKVFDTYIDLLTEPRECDRLHQMYLNSAQFNTHTSCRGYDVKNIYTVDIPEMTTEFNEKGKGLGDIRELFHGTSVANVLSIMKAGLKTTPPSTAAIAGKLLGNGTYFAHTSTKSLNYSIGFWTGSSSAKGYLFVCDVAMGKSYTPLNLHGPFPAPGFDSVHAKAGQTGHLKNDEYVVYKNYQVKPKYLLELSR